MQFLSCNRHTKLKPLDMVTKVACLCTFVVSLHKSTFWTIRSTQARSDYSFWVRKVSLQLSLLGLWCIFSLASLLLSLGVGAWRSSPPPSWDHSIFQVRPEVILKQGCLLKHGNQAKFLQDSRPYLCSKRPHLSSLSQTFHRTLVLSVSWLSPFPDQHVCRRYQDL